MENWVGLDRFHQITLGCARAMPMTGHKTRAVFERYNAVFERYNIVSPGDLRDAAQRLEAFATGAAS